jgi:hypothetical protein
LGLVADVLAGIFLMNGSASTKKPEPPVPDLHYLKIHLIISQQEWGEPEQTKAVGSPPS